MGCLFANYSSQLEGLAHNICFGAMRAGREVRRGRWPEQRSQASLRIALAVQLATRTSARHGSPFHKLLHMLPGWASVCLECAPVRPSSVTVATMEEQTTDTSSL